MDLSLTPLFLLPIIAGYLFIIDCEVTRYRVVREDGHRLYFRSAFHGYWITLLIFVTVVVLFSFGIGTLPTVQQLALISVVLSPIIAMLLAWAVNRLVDENKFVDEVLRENQFEFLLASAIDEKR